MAQLKEGSIIKKSTGDEVVATVTDLTNKIDKTSITSDLAGTDETKVLSQEGANELNKKFDTISSSRSATIVIANYDSTEKSKKGADYVVKNGEDASKVIMNAEQELVGFGGKILLMEGKYDCQSAIVLGYAETTLEGCNATLVQNENWSGTEYGDGKTSGEFLLNPEGFKDVVIQYLKIEMKEIKSSSAVVIYNSSIARNLKISGGASKAIVIDAHGSTQVVNCVVNNSKGNGIYCYDSSQVSNCTVSDAGVRGISCYDSSQVSNCTVSGTGDGISCFDSSQVSNCTVSDAGVRGISCYDSSQISNCTVSSAGYGISCFGSFEGICSFNVLKGCKLSDSSSTPAKIEYNVIQ